MASPYLSQQHQPPAERPWIGMALLVAVPLLALVLIRMLWSGSGLWFLTVGIILLGLAAIVFLARRPQEGEYGSTTLAPEPNRLPLVLTGLGVLFLAMLLLPNFADGGDDSSTVLQESEVSGAVTQPTVAQSQQAQPTVAQPAQDQAAQQPPASAAEDTTTDPSAVTGETYVVQDGDTLWDIATRYSVTTDEIIAANGLDSPDDIAIGDELIIPATSAEGESTDETAG